MLLHVVGAVCKSLLARRSGAARRVQRSVAMPAYKTESDRDSYVKAQRQRHERDGGINRDKGKG